MTGQKKRAVVVCPGRGTYNRQELGYLQKYHADKQDMLAGFDDKRKENGLASVTSLDQAATFRSKEHLAAQNAAPLIYSCAYSDYLNIDRDKYDIVAVTGNSMGWYIALACAGALDANKGFDLVTGMSGLTSGASLGGQLIYPVVDNEWRPDPQKQQQVQSLLNDPDVSDEERLYLSIQFGGYVVLAGSNSAIQRAMSELPVVDDRFPLQLPGHSAFHTPLMKQGSEKALKSFATDFFSKPDVPLIDGDGHIWQPNGTNLEKLRAYTLIKQVTETYNFSKAIEVAVKEFAPDCLILTGPGMTMGGAAGQALIELNWNELDSKTAFQQQQESDPYVIAMGMELQRKLAV